MGDFGTPAVDRLMLVLNALEAGRSALTAAELAARTGLPRATLYRLLGSMRAHGLVVEDPPGAGAFALGPRLAQLGQKVLSAGEIEAIAQPVMDRLSKDVAQTVKLAVRDGTMGLVVAVSQAQEDHRITARVGLRYPIHIGPSVRLLLAGASEDEIDEFLKVPLPRHASGTITDPALMRSAIAEMRRTGWAEGVSEGFEGIGAMAAAISSATNDVRAALSVVFIGTLPNQTDTWRPALRAAAGEISRSLGGRTDWRDAPRDPLATGASATT